MYDIDMLEGALRHRDKRIRTLEAERDSLAALCAEAADVLDKTANDTLLGRNMADKLRRQAEEDKP